MHHQYRPNNKPWKIVLWNSTLYLYGYKVQLFCLIKAAERLGRCQSGCAIDLYMIYNIYSYFVCFQYVRTSSVPSFLFSSSHVECNVFLLLLVRRSCFPFLGSRLAPPHTHTHTHKNTQKHTQKHISKLLVVDLNYYITDEEGAFSRKTTSNTTSYYTTGVSKT